MNARPAQLAAAIFIAAAGLLITAAAPATRPDSPALAFAPRHGEIKFPRLRENNRLDTICFAKLRELRIPPSELCSDFVFLRRVFLDCIGTLPSVEQTRQFLSSQDPQKRSKLIDWLLDRPEFADYWAMKWGDLLRIKSEYPVRLWPKAAATYQRWVKESIAANKPYNQFVREMLLSSGSNFRDGACNYYRAVGHKDPQTFADATCLLFLGQRIGCARCHAHPTEKWTLDDELGLAAFFAKVAFKATSEWKEEIVYVDYDASFHDPKSKRLVEPRFPGGSAMQVGVEEDPRVRFTDWLISSNNPDLARNAVNRIWFWLMGRGIVQEPDDFRASNPPSNPQLLDYLASQLIEHAYDTKYIYRLILNSGIYQLSSRTNELNRSDETYFSHHRLRRLDAEVLLDALSQVTQTTDLYVSTIPEPFTRLKDFRAIDIGDGSIPSPFLQLFGRPPRDTPFQSERCSQLNVRQELHLLNSAEIDRKITGSVRIKRLLDNKASDAQIADEFYLAALSRYPTPAEKQFVTAYMQHDRTAHFKSVQDVLWAILNTREFLFVQ